MRRKRTFQPPEQLRDWSGRLLRMTDAQYLISRTHADFPISGLRRDSAVNCSNLYAIRQSDVTRVIGRLTQATMEQIDSCLKSALGIL